MHELIEVAIERSGGLGAWREARRVEARLSFGGLAFASRWQGGAGGLRRFSAALDEPRIVLDDYPGDGRIGVFTAVEVLIQDREGEVLRRRASPRASFGDLRHRIWWDALDLLYFAGYASWNYLTTPFLLSWDGVDAVELEPWKEAGQRWRRLRVTFPISIPTHCREQTFYFDDEHRLRRFDYTPEVFGAWARAAHYCTDFRRTGALEAPRRRRVVPRRPDGTSRKGPTLVWIEIEEIELVGD